MFDNYTRPGIDIVWQKDIKQNTAQNMRRA